jgi:uncharacterized membrane protein
MAVKRRNGWIVGGVAAGILVVVVAAVSAGMLDGLLKKSSAEAGKAAGVVETTDAVRIPLKALDSGKALFLALESEGRQVHYFALKSRDGAYRAALDACDVCFKSNRGYRQEADQMVCNNCGQTFPSNRIGETKGGCNPHPLARKIDGQYLVIGKAGIVAGREYFAGKRS